MNIMPVECLRFWNNLRRLGIERGGQDLIEYALMAGLVATGVVTMSPVVATSFITIISSVNSVIVLAGAS